MSDLHLTETAFNIPHLTCLQVICSPKLICFILAYPPPSNLLIKTGNWFQLQIFSWVQPWCISPMLCVCLFITHHRCVVQISFNRYVSSDTFSSDTLFCRSNLLAPYGFYSCRVVRTKCFLCTFYCCRKFWMCRCSFNIVSLVFSPVDLVSMFSACRLSLTLKMGHGHLCPNTPKKRKKSPKRSGQHGQADWPALPPAQHQGTTPSPSDMKGTGSAHKGQHLGQWWLVNMKKALKDWAYYEERWVWLGLWRLERSKAKIAHDHGISPATFGNQTLCKVEGYEHASEGVRCPKVLTVSKSSDTLFKQYSGVVCMCQSSFK